MNNPGKLAEAHTSSPGPLATLTPLDPSDTQEYSGNRPACLSFPFILSQAQLPAYSMLTLAPFPLPSSPASVLQCIIVLSLSVSYQHRYTMLIIPPLLWLSRDSSPSSSSKHLARASKDHQGQTSIHAASRAQEQGLDRGWVATCAQLCDRAHVAMGSIATNKLHSNQ